MFVPLTEFEPGRGWSELFFFRNFQNRFLIRVDEMLWVWLSQIYLES